VATATPANSATITPTFSISPTSTLSPTFTLSATSTPTPQPPGSPATFTLNDWLGNPVAGAVVMVNNDTTRTGLTNASGQCSINITSTTAAYTAFFFSPQDGSGNPLMEPAVVVAFDVSGTSVTQGGDLRPVPAPVWGNVVLTSVSNVVSTSDTLMVTWLAQPGNMLGSCQYVPISGLPFQVTTVARTASAVVVLSEIDAGGNTVASAWVPLTYTAAGVNFMTGLGQDFTVNTRTYSAYAPVDPRLTTFRGFLLPFWTFGEFLAGPGALFPDPSQAESQPQTLTDLLPVAGAVNHHPTLAAWGAGGGNYYFSWNLFESGTNDDYNPSPFYLPPPPAFNSVPSGQNTFQTSSRQYDWTWVVVSKAGTMLYPEFYPEFETMRLFHGVSTSGTNYDWDLTVNWPSGISAAKYGVQGGQSYKVTTGDTYCFFNYPGCVAGTQQIYITNVCATDQIVVH
jgi:hypothetical protein